MNSDQEASAGFSKINNNINESQLIIMWGTIFGRCTDGELIRYLESEITINAAPNWFLRLLESELERRK